MNSLDENLYKKIFFSHQIREIDEYTIRNEPISSIDLMERAACRIFQFISSVYGKDIVFKVFAGVGNNGGDAIALARILYLAGYSVELFIIQVSDKFSKESEINIKRYKSLSSVTIKHIVEISYMPLVNKDDVIIDGLFGTGLSRPVKGLGAEVINKLNTSGAEIISIDIPSGLMADNSFKNETRSIVRARYTLSIEFPKLSFLFPENENYMGDLVIIPIGLHPNIIDSINTKYSLLLRCDLAKKVNRLSKFTHKGKMGHALLISGSYGKMGAAILAGRACLRTGVGLLSIHIPEKGYDIMQISVPEAMVDVDKSEKIFTDIDCISKYNAIGIGSGMGVATESYKAMKKLFENSVSPIVIDADALNIISENSDLWEFIPKNSILTPHIGEFARLVGDWENSNQRIEKQIELAQKYSLIVLVKGAYTTIVTPNGDCYFNTSGNPGMATAGMGDVLTGMILALLAQGYDSIDAAMLGVYLHGLSGDIAVANKGERSLIASDVVDFIGDSWEKLLKKN